MSSTQLLLRAGDENDEGVVDYSGDVFVAKSVDEVLSVINGFGLYQFYFALYWTILIGAGGMVSMSFIMMGRKEQPVCNKHYYGNCSTVAGSTRDVCKTKGYTFPQGGTFSYSSTFDLACDRRDLLPVPTMSYFAGFAVGAWAFGWVTDKFGRKPVFMLTSTAALISHVAMCLSRDFIFFCICKLLIGVFFGGQMSAAWNLLMEILSPKYRAFVGGCCWCVWSLMVSVNPLISYAVDSWYKENRHGGEMQHLHSWQLSGLIMGVPMLVILLFSNCCLRESPRYLLSKGKVDDAMEALEEIAAYNKKLMPICDFQTRGGPPEASAEGKANERLSTIDLFRDWNVALITVTVTYLWFSTNVAYYGMSIELSRIGSNVYDSVVYSSALEAPAYLSTGFVLKYFGRKSVMTVCLLQGGICCLISAFLADWKGAHTLVQILAFASKFGITLSFSVVYVYTSELFPTSLRGVAYGVANVGARLGGVLAPELLLAKTPSIIFGAIAILGAIASAAFLPETKDAGTLETLADMKDLGGKRSKATPRNQAQTIS